MDKIVRMLVLAMAVFTASIATINAQGTARDYTVQAGDTAWDLAEKYYSDPLTWQRIVDMNPMLREPGRVVMRDSVKRPGTTDIILILRPGEKLAGLELLDVELPTAIPIEELRVLPASTPATPAKASGPSTWFLWLTAALAAIGAIWVACIAARIIIQQRRAEALERELRQDPITSGPAFVPGGIPTNRPDDLRNFFEQQAIAAYAQRNQHVDRNTIRVEQIGPIERITLSGEGEVGYLGQNDWRPRRLPEPLDGYQARYRFPDRTEQVLQCLQGCMNPIRMGGEVMRGFTTTVREAVVPAPAPVQPGPVPAPAPAFAAAATMAEARREGRNSINVHGEVLTFNRGYQVVVHEDNSITVSGEQAELTVKPKRVVAKKTPRPATGTLG